MHLHALYFEEIGKTKTERGGPKSIGPLGVQAKREVGEAMSAFRQQVHLAS